MIIVIDLLYGPIAFCAKLSLFLLYYRLFSLHRWMRYLVYLGIGSSAAMYTAGTIVYGYLCLPRPGQSWIEAGLSSRCHQQFIMIGYVRGPFNLLSDLYLLSLPLPAVWQLHMPLQKKLGLAGIFLTGSLWVPTSYQRTMLINYAALVSRVSSACTFGSRFISPQILHGTWPLLSPRCKYAGVLLEPTMLRHPRVLELNIGTICASLPFLPAFYQHHRLKPSQVAALKTITNKIRAFRSGRKTRDARLETGILGSVQGEGKFLQSGDLTNISGSTDMTDLTEK